MVMFVSKFYFLVEPFGSGFQWFGSYFFSDRLDALGSDTQS